MIKKEYFGTLPDGRQVDIYTLSNGRMTARIGTLGATLISLTVPDRKGGEAEVLLGYDTLEGYIRGTEYMSATVGRFANRIEKGRFSLGGREYRLTLNDGENSLHGGIGFHKAVWQGEIAGDTLRLRHESPDGDAGYPAKLSVCVSFSIDGQNGLHIDYAALPDAPTICSLTNHAYFNFTGGRENMLSHELFIDADKYTAVNGKKIPVGDLPVENTVFDFRTPKKIGRAIYDHNFCLKGGKGPQATLYEEKSGIFMEVFTDRPAMQVYSSTMLAEQTARSGCHYGLGHGVCLETQLPPNAPNRPGLADACVITPEKPFRSSTVYRFSVR